MLQGDAPGGSRIDERERAQVTGCPENGCFRLWLNRLLIWGGGAAGP